MIGMITFLNILGTIAFSISGAIEAIKKQMDVLGVIVLGIVTAIGGGILRDIIMGELPPAIFHDHATIIISLIISLITFINCYIFPKERQEKYIRLSNKILFMSDSVGLGAFTILGIRLVNEQYGYNNPALLIFVGVLTGVGGGILRDILAGNVPYVLRKHVYATASIIGAVTYLVLMTYSTTNIATMVTLVLVLLIRILAAYYSWNLPRIKI